MKKVLIVIGGLSINLMAVVSTTPTNTSTPLNAVGGMVGNTPTTNGTQTVYAGNIYDGTGSLVNSYQVYWGGDRDEAVIHPHLDKTSTVTFQVLKDVLNCDHIDISSSKDLNQDVKINLKNWKDTVITKSYTAKLPIRNSAESNGVSIDTNEYPWTTLSITTTKPITEKYSIYAYCKKSIVPKDTTNLIKLDNPIMTQLDSNHYYMGNGSLISTLHDNSQDGYGITQDWAQTSDKYDAETTFQVQSSDECKEVTIEDRKNGTNVEQILYKGWDQAGWKQSNCIALPCTIDTYFKDDGRNDYIVINIKTKAGANNHLSAKCGVSEVNIDLNETIPEIGNPNNCKFDDVPTSNSYHKYITAICSAKILQGNEADNYKNFYPNRGVSYYPFVKVIGLVHNYYTDFDYDSYLYPAVMVSNGMAYKHLVSTFWNKSLSEEDAKKFLEDRKVDIEDYAFDSSVSRGYLSKIVLQSARISADENAIERKLPYVNHKQEDLDIGKSKDIPESVFTIPIADDSSNTKSDIIDKNIQETKKSNSTVSKSGSTDNTGLTIAIIGGKDNLKPEYQDKNANEMMQEAMDKGDLEPTSNTYSKDTKLKFLENSDGESIAVVTVPQKDSNGNNQNLVETSPQNVEIVTNDELKKGGWEEKGSVSPFKIIKPKPSFSIPVKSTLKKTGQNKSYDVDGNIVTDGSIKDDGYYQAGVIHSYTRDDDNEIVIDNLTGLEWQDNESITKPFITKYNYDNGIYNNSGDTADTYCSNLNIGSYSDWRLPTLMELFNIVDNSRYTPSSFNAIFESVDNKENFWSSTNLVNATIPNSGSWYYDFGNISYSPGGGSGTLIGYFYQYTKCIRGNDLSKESNFVRTDNGIVTDNSTNLQWQDNITIDRMGWVKSINYCEDLTLGDYSDWRLPNKNEFISILDLDRGRPSIDSIFTNDSCQNVWSSTTSAHNPKLAWSFDLINGNARNTMPKSYGNNAHAFCIRCVRGGL